MFNIFGSDWMSTQKLTGEISANCMVGIEEKKMKILPHANWRLIGDDEGFVLISRLLHTDIDLYYIKLSQKTIKHI